MSGLDNKDVADRQIVYTKKSKDAWCFLENITPKNAKVKNDENSLWTYMAFPSSLKVHQSVLAYLQLASRRNGDGEGAAVEGKRKTDERNQLTNNIHDSIHEMDMSERSGMLLKIAKDSMLVVEVNPAAITKKSSVSSASVNEGSEREREAFVNKVASRLLLALSKVDPSTNVLDVSVVVPSFPLTEPLERLLNQVDRQSARMKHVADSTGSTVSCVIRGSHITYQGDLSFSVTGLHDLPVSCLAGE